MASRTRRTEETTPEETPETTPEQNAADAEAAQNDGGPGTDPETGAPADVEKVKSLDEANAAAIAGDGDTTSSAQDAYAKGYYGTSPVREATGLDDKGLSQNTPSVMNQGVHAEDEG